MVTPKISIITPSFNQAAYLEDTNQSVLGQQYSNLEYIIIDGGATDGSVEIIKKYENQLSYWESTPDKGMYYAIQKGFEKSTGKIMAWINSDDMYHQKALFTVAEIFSLFPNVKWLQGFTTLFDELGKTVVAYGGHRFNKFDFYNYDYQFIQQESTFWRRDLWDKSGARMDCSLKYAGDFALWLNFFSYSDLYITNALIVGFRMRSNNQLSRDHRQEYLNEANSKINALKLNKKEKTILRFYKWFLFLIKFIKLLKIFRTEWIISRYRKKYLPYTEMITFNQTLLKFEMTD